MTLHDNFRRIAATATIALATALGAGAALAQPGPGPHGAGPGEMAIGQLIERAKTQLNLNTSQLEMFNAAVAQGKAARESGRLRHQKVKAAVTDELANQEPDLAKLAAISDSAHSEALTSRHQVREAWLKVYATFNHEQKLVVRDMLQKRMARAEAFGQRMRQHFLEMHGGTGG